MLQDCVIPDDLALSSYDYTLPDSLIAAFPKAQRDHARMLVVNRQTREISHHSFQDLPQFLTATDLVVVNNTRVIPARLKGNRRGFTGKVEILALYPDADSPNTWTAMLKPIRKLAIGTCIELPQGHTAEVVELIDGGKGRVKFHLASSCSSVLALLEQIGEIPIPPYLNREVVAADKETYQTVYAKASGEECLPSQAAPTAGLHFTPDMIKRIQDQGTGFETVTLSVSTGTFRSVVAEDVREHRMDAEYYTLPEQTVTAITTCKKQGGRVLAIGTTSAKTLETVANHHHGNLAAESAWSNLFIYPGFQFQVVDALLTNFHLPKTTLLMLISAFADRKLILEAYEEAVQAEYRFFSYGDCMLIL